MNNCEQIPLRSKGRYDYVALDKILFLRAEGNYTFVFISDGSKYLMSKLLKHYENTFSHQQMFVRVHAKYIVNLDYCIDVNLNGKEVILKDARIPLARRRKHDFMTKYLKYLSSSLVDGEETAGTKTM